MEAKSIERQGARIAYEVGGDGPAILLGHSLLCDRRMWEGVAPGLATSHRVINVEARGHGKSTAPSPFSLEDLADDWRAVLDEEKVDRVLLCGLSMGGMTAMRLALSDRRRIAGLALLDSSADRETPLNRVKYLAMALAVRRFGHLDPLYQEVAKIMFGATTLGRSPQVVQREILRFKEKDPKQIFHAVRAVIDRGSLLGRVRELRLPTAILVGEEDRATPPIRSRRLLAAIPGSRLHVITGAGHLSAIEQPSAVNRVLAGFLNQISW